MGKLKVLITSVSRKVSLVKAFKEAGWCVVAQDQNLDSPALYFADWRVQHVSPAIKVDLIVPTRDAELWDYDTPLKPRMSKELCFDRLAFNTHLKQLGFAVPHVYYVRPRTGSVTADFKTLPKEEQLLWQEFVNADEYSIDVFATFEGDVISVVPRRRVKIVGGEAWVSVTVENSAILNGALELSRKLGLIGHNVLQCFLVDGSPIWLEVNCRFGGASALAIHAGCKSPEWLAKLVRGERVKPCIGEYKVGVKMLRYTEDIFV